MAPRPTDRPISNPRAGRLRPARVCALAALVLVLAGQATAPSTRPADDVARRVLVYSRTAGFRHDSIPDGVAAVRALGREHGFTVEATEDPAVFTDKGLKRFDAVVFLNTTGDVLDDEQQTALQRWYRAGGGFVGVHSATDTEYDWPWYRQLVGARFKRHPPVQPAILHVVDGTHRSTLHLRRTWERTDEWYDFDAVPENVRVLLRLDPESYEGGTMGDDHPIAWCHVFDGGRSWYTAGGHTKAAFAEPDFRRHLLGGIAWAAQWPEEKKEK